jgi:NAD(P)-dependent dehydrogenase (short-subunit alcohol dehydrogenase family)
MEKGATMQDLRDKVVLITGAASGIGRATAVEFAREGAGPLILCDINAEGLEETAAMIEGMGRSALALPADVSNHESVRKMVEKALEQAGRIDVLVNVAGIGIGGPMEVLTMEDWRKVLGVNLFGMLHTVDLIYPHMLERGSGQIVNIASGAGLAAPSPYNSPYNTSKFGAVGFSESLLLEAGAHGIGVTCICPGIVKTPIYETSPIKGFTEEMAEKLEMVLLVGEEPEDTARSIVKAVKKNRFLVVTTFLMKALVLVKRYFPFIWFPVNKMISRGLMRYLERYSMR